MKHSFVASLICIATFAATSATHAAPLPNGKLLPITPGDYSDCTITGGSCWAMEVSPGFWIWFPIVAGSDGGLIVGKNQASGGQENCNSYLFTPGELTAAWSWTGSPGTFATTPLVGCKGTAPHDASYNVFDDTSCAGASCLGKTTLGTWNTAFNGSASSWGSADGCRSINCNAAQLAGIFINEWTYNPDGTYVLDYSNVIPDGDPSGFGGVRLRVRIQNTGVLPNNSPVANAGPDQAVDEGTIVNLSGTCTDTDGTIASCVWSCQNFTLTQSATGVGTASATATATFTAPSVTATTTFGCALTATDDKAATGTDTMLVTVKDTTASCKNQTPYSSVYLAGGGQSPSVDATLTEHFTGYIVSYTNNSVTVCNDTTLFYEAVASVVTVCTINGSPSASSGIVTPGDKLVCTNKPAGQDTDRIRILGK